MRYSNKEEFKKALKKRAYNFSIQLVNFTEGLPRGNTCFIIGNQLLRSGTSIGANIVEAQGASSKRDFINFLTYAFKSSNETRYWLGLLRDTEKADQEQANSLLTEADELSKILSSILLSLKGKK